MSIMRSISLLLSFSVVSSHPSALDKRLTQSKIDQFTTTDCSDDDGKENRVSSNVNIPIDTCISIDGKTHSIYLARGTGLVWRRGMVAYSQTGCPDNVRIESFEEHDSGSACMNVDYQMLGVPGTEISHGRIMSVKFVGV